MRRLLLLLAVCLVPATLFLMYGCGPRSEVAKKELTDRLDDMLGKMDVQRAEIDDGIKATKKAVEGVRKARITAQVKCDQIDEKAKPYEEKLAQCDQTLTKLRDLLKADMPADIAGKTYAVEIDGLERSITAIDRAIVEAQSVVRRLERERAGIGDEEMGKLAEQLREVEERTDGVARTPVTPLDVDAALDKALKGSRNSKPSQPSTALADKRLVGKWEIVEGEQKGTATFTEGGTVLFAWFHRDLKRNLTETGNYALAGKSLKIKASGEYDGESVREIEFLSDDELLLHRPKGFNFTWMYGRLKRAK